MSTSSNRLFLRSDTREVDYDTNPTILYKSVEQQQWKGSISRVCHAPHEASTWVTMEDSGGGKWRRLPIQQACRYQPPLELITALIKAFPASVQAGNENGDLPLHSAVKWGSSAEVVQEIAMAYPEGVDVKNKWGETPVDLIDKAEYSPKMRKQVCRALQGKDIGEEISPAGDADVFKQRTSLVIVVIGASGDLAKKKTYPSLLNLFGDGLLPDKVIVWGFARSAITHEDLRAKLKPFLLKSGNHTEEVVDNFLSVCFYKSGKAYGDVDAYKAMNSEIVEYETEHHALVSHNRLFYFAIPPNVFAETGIAIKQCAMADRGWTRIIVEKPFGRDLGSYEALSKTLTKHFTEDHLYRIDHYLGKEMVQNLMVLRFSNLWFERLWNRNDVACVILTFKEPFGTEGRGGYFDKFGIIRDILQNHLLQVLTLLAMEPPVKVDGPEASQKVRDAKVQVLNSMPPITLDDIVLGQYEGYTDDPTIENKDSNTPTFAVIRCFVRNPRWAGVPFILKAGKALDERKAEMRIQFKDAPAAEFLFDNKCPRNELVMRMQPKEAIYMKTNVKTPGFSTTPIQAELEVNYDARYYERTGEVNPDAYTRLILDVLKGRQAAFVRDDELRRSWEIFTPLLHQIEQNDVKPIIYKQGGRGPKEADDFIRDKCNYIRNDEYKFQE